ncbi:hypothetical protein K435DRAFT_578937, partial [Dendrothele bispora CBS 962.96]
VGLPIIIRQNYATELCITNGQEGTVYGWQEATGPNGQRVLDTLFVKLTNPPKKVEIPGLPENIVPLSRSSQTTQCMLPNDTTITVEREQVMILPSFAMTDYVSQGKTRSQNIIHCENLRNHHSYYTAFSRSSSADGLILLDDIDVQKIQRGISGFLRQEFRELMLLDELTELRYNHKLDPRVYGETRNQLLRSYQNIKGNNYDPLSIPHALSSQSKKDSKVPPLAESTNWQLIGQRKTLQSSKNAKEEKNSNTGHTNRKKRKVNENNAHQRAHQGTITMRGMIWDSNNWSCPYDAIFTILFNVWQEDPSKWSPILMNLTTLLSELITSFDLFIQCQQTLEQSRDIIREKLHNLDPDSFPYGQLGGHIDVLAHHVFGSITYSSAYQLCRQCKAISVLPPDLDFHSNIRPAMDIYPDSKWASRFQRPYYVQDWLQNFKMHPIENDCPSCNSISHQYAQISLNSVPHLLYFNIYDSRMNVSQKIFLEQPDREIARFTLKGITYLGGYHFTCRFIDATGSMYYHDGI